ncbi:MAG: 2-phosphosulfolactate phosphatase [bacterium]
MTQEPFVVVLADILRATTSIVTAFANGAVSMVPVADIEEAKAWKARGYLVASEQDGNKLDFADFGNSPYSFTPEAIAGKTIVYCTTNGTRALEEVRSGQLAVGSPQNLVVIGAFLNLSAVGEWLDKEAKPVVILCSGWKQKFCLEDSLFAGALTELLLTRFQFHTGCDAANASIDLWKLAQPDLLGYVEKASHRKRLQRLGLDDILAYSFQQDSTDVVPVFNGEKIYIVDHD